MHPKDMLLVGMNPAPPGVSLKAKKINENGDRAKVQIRRGKILLHTLELQRIDGRWRVSLPVSALRATPTSKPSSLLARLYFTSPVSSRARSHEPPSIPARKHRRARRSAAGWRGCG